MLTRSITWDDDPCESTADTPREAAEEHAAEGWDAELVHDDEQPSQHTPISVVVDDDGAITKWLVVWGGENAVAISEAVARDLLAELDRS